MVQGLEIVAYRKDMEWEEYLVPKSLDEALEMLEQYPGVARIIAGGTDIVPASRKGTMAIKALVDITRIPGLDKIILDRGTVKIGPLVTHTEVALSGIIRERGMALAEGASHLGSPQIRNIGTVAGNIISAQPGGDTLIPLLSLDGSVTVMSRQGERTVPLTELFTEVGQTTIDSTKEIVTRISFPALGKGEASASLRLAKRKTLVLPILTVSVVIGADQSRKNFTKARIAMGPVATIPVLCTAAGEMLEGSTISEEVIKKAAAEAEKVANPRTSLIRGTSEYRKAMVAVLVERGITAALKRLE
ncbi:MAG: xanthine dehydrogenase family protein subunit M [Candidatus Latescibacterota bacterium]